MKNEDVFNHTVVFAKNYYHKLEITDDSPLRTKQYPIPYQYQKQVNEEIEKLIQQGIIRRSNSYFVSPVVIVRKANNTLRLCLDARAVNERLKPGYEQCQNMEVLISRCVNKKYFSKIDLRNAFWLIKLEESSKKYCAFNINGSIYEFCVCPFGIKSSPAALIRFLHQILNKYEEFCSHYFDDILIFSKDAESHIKHLNIIISTLQDSGMKINLEKCQFFRKQVNYLGHIINQEGIKLDPIRLEEIRTYPRPKRIKDIRAFLGLLNYYHRFIPNYSKRTLPLLKLLKKNQKWIWDTEQQKAFEELRNSFINTLQLYHPNFDLEFILRTDASNFAIASELVQFQNDIEVPIQFVSRTLKDSEIKYSVSEKEALSIIYSVTKLRFYLLGRKFKIETDHKALLQLTNKRFTNSRIYRWSLLLNEYDFDMFYKPGKNMIAADILSRKYEQKAQAEVIISNIQLNRVGMFSTRNLKQVQEHPDIQHIIKKLENIPEDYPTEVIEYKGYFLEEGILKKRIGRKTNIVVDEKFTKELITQIHVQYVHIGTRKCWLIFREAFYSKNDEKIIKTTLRSCELCQLSKEKNRTLQNIPRSIRTSEPLEIIAIDFLSNLPTTSKGYKNILVIYDIFSKFVKLIPTKICDTETTLEGLNYYIYEFGKPKIVLSDNATYFNNDRYRRYLNEIDIKTYYSSIRHPQGNPSERAIKEVIKYLRILLPNQHNSWQSKLAKIEHVLNHTPNTVHEESPIELMCGIKAYRPWKGDEIINLQEQLQEARQKLQKKADKWESQQRKKLRTSKMYQIGDEVLVKTLKVTDKKRKITAKLLKPYSGPYVIINRYNQNTYQLWDSKTDTIKGKFHISHLYDYVKEVEENMNKNQKI